MKTFLKSRVQTTIIGALILISCPSFALPTVAQLQTSGKTYLQDKAFATGDFFSSTKLSTAVPKLFYHIDQYQDYALDSGQNTVARIVGIYEIKRDDTKVVPFAVFFTEQGLALNITGTFLKPDENCLPYFFYPLGSVAIRYHAQRKGSDLWQLRLEMMKALETTLDQSTLSNRQESISLMLRPNADQYESQQTIQVSNAKEFYENDIAEAAKKMTVPGVANIDGGVARSGNPVNGFFGPGGATCVEIK